MATIQCSNFVGNAWKKDLCMNCFKSKEEHVTKNGISQTIAPLRIPDPPKNGILKICKSTSKGNKVIFPTTEFEVIGFGGDDVYSDEDDDYPDSSFCDLTENDTAEDSEEDKQLQKLTKTNTDFNSIPENLQEPKEGEVKKVIEPLQLGKQLLDNKGNKKTLLVSVTPFGDQSPVTKKINVSGVKASLSFSQEVKTNGHTDSEGNSDLIKKDIVVTVKPRTFSEKTESVADENINKPDSVNGGLKESEDSECDIAQNTGDSNGKGSNDKSLKRSQPLDKNFKFRLSKDLQKENEKDEGTKMDKIKTSEIMNNLLDKAKRKVTQFPIITENSNYKLKAKDFTGSLGRKATENNKAVVLNMYNLKDTKDVKAHNEINEGKSNKKLLTQDEMRNKFLSSEAKISSSTLNEFKEEDNLDANVKDSEISVTDKDVEPAIDRSKLIPNVSSLYSHHFKNVMTRKEVEEDKPLEIISPLVKPLMNGVVSSMPLVQSIECTFLDKSYIGKDSEGLLLGNETFEEECNSVKVEKFKKRSFDSFENFEKIIKDEEITLFSAEKKMEGGKKENERKVEREEQEVVAVPEISRESAGEPDGRADSDDLSEPPALPLKPPPPLTESRSTFLSDLTLVGGGGGGGTGGGGGEEAAKMAVEKPKVPVKPASIHAKKINFQSPAHSNRPKSPSIEKFLDTSSTQPKSHLPLQETLSSDSIKNQKRPAPKPPSPKDDLSQRFAAVLSDMDSCKPDQQEIENGSVRRISRSTENLLEFITNQDQKNQLSAEGLEEISVPEPVPRRSLSLSQDSLVPCDAGDQQSKKKPSRGRFFLRKLLHLGKPKDSNSKDLNTRQKSFLPPATKPKLEIIHPSDLNGARVEVVPPARPSKNRRTSSSASSSSGEQRESDVLSDSSTSHSMSSSGNDSQDTIDQTKKPPPPPRAHSLDNWSTKPARPPPPKSIDILRQNNSSSLSIPSEKKPDNLYVNLGEARSGLAPNKPLRTGSLREANLDNTKRLVTVTTQLEDSDYESFVMSSAQSPSPQPDDNVYECVQGSNHRSSLPECDSSMSEYTKGKRSPPNRNNSHRRSDGSVEINSDCFKMKYSRSVSLPYCVSETESEIYSPYSFYGSEMGEADYEDVPTNQALQISRLKLKKGRSIVHKNLEDNYGAVVIANHEALAQVVEQMRQGPAAPAVLRALSTAINLRWTDFTIPKDASGVIVERRVFYPALWGTHNVTLGLVAELGLNSRLHAKGPFNLNPIAELNDLVPASYLPMLKKDDSELIQASISVLARLQIETVETYGRSMNSGVLNDESKKEVNFVLLQIINAFKSLQAQGIEEAPKTLSNMIVCREERDPHPRLCITHSMERSEEGTSFCQCLLHTIKDILPPTDLTPLIANVLRKEKAVSLSQAKGILEFSIWGPSDIAFGNSTRERESALQRWLDLERATVLHGLVRTRAELTVFEEWQLLFLVRTSAKIMAEASLLLESGFIRGEV